VTPAERLVSKLDDGEVNGETDCGAGRTNGSLDGVPVETSVVFGDRAVEIGVKAECFNADLVVMPLPRRHRPAVWMSAIARRLRARRPANPTDVLRVWALRPEPMV